MGKEKNFENKIKEYLKNQGNWYVKYWAGAAYTKSGIPDLLVCSRGNFLGIEIKADNGKPSLLQLHNLKKIRDAGGYGLLLYPKDLEQFKKFIRDGPKDGDWYKSNITTQQIWEIKLLSEE